MQRYHATNCTSAVNNTAVGGSLSRDNTSRAESSSSLPPNFPLNRRTSQLAPYKLRCEKDPLNSRLPPPDFHPPTTNCPEETLTKDYVSGGYRETVEGLEESREISLSQIPTFTKPVILKCKEAIRKYHRAINESRAQKRKAGQVYGVPLTGNLLSKPGVFPEQKASGEDFRKKWIEGLSQQQKRLRSLADHVPHGYRRKSLFEVLIRNNVPLLRATWFIKVTYLNQVRPGAGSSSGTPDKSRYMRSDQWTKDVIEYLQYLLDEFVSKNNNNSHSALNVKDRSPSQFGGYGGGAQHKNDVVAVVDGEEPSVHFKWWYVVRIIQWHHAEGLLLPSLIIDWVLNQLQEKESLGTLQLLLPILYTTIETLIQSQSYVRTLVTLSLRFLHAPSHSHAGSDLVQNSRTFYTLSALSNILHFLLLQTPDSFISLNIFPLPPSLLSTEGTNPATSPELQGPISSIQNLILSIQSRADTLARAARPGHPGPNLAKWAHELDTSITHGDVGPACKLIFDDSNNEFFDKKWIGDVSASLRSSLKHLGMVHDSFMCAVFFICEWATCEFRDSRNAPISGVKFTGKRDFSQVHIASRILGTKAKKSRKKAKDLTRFFASPGAVHDVIVCWIDQHQVLNSEGFKRVLMLVTEFVKSGIFYPQAYVRELIVSGVMGKNDNLHDVERKRRHYKVLKNLPGSYVQDLLEEAQVADVAVVSEGIQIYANERRLLLHENVMNTKVKKFGGIPKNVDNSEKSVKVEEVMASISILLHFPNSGNTGIEDSHGVKRTVGPVVSEGMTPGCEECRRAKRQKVEEKNPFLHLSDDEDMWWVRKGGVAVKPMEVFRVDPPVKPVKQPTRGRQKMVRKTQSLAQLAAARIEGSQGASTSHVCDSRVNCPHHRNGSDAPKPPDSTGITNSAGIANSGDVSSIGKAIKRVALDEKRVIVVWLIGIVKQLVDEAGKVTDSGVKSGQFGRNVAVVDEKGNGKWKLGEDELNNILYLMDVCDDLVSAARFLVWLLPKVYVNPIPTVHGGRNVMIVPRNVENHFMSVGESYVLSSLKRYENILAAAELIPETLTAMMQRASQVMSSNSRLSGSPSLIYARHLLKKYAHVAAVIDWSKAFKQTSDNKRLIMELESARSSDGEFGFPLGVPAGIQDFDEFLRQKITGIRISRVGVNMRDTVQRLVDENTPSFYGQDKRSTTLKKDDGYPLAQQVVKGLLDCMRQTGGAAQEGDPTLVAFAVSAVVTNVGQVIGKITEITPASISFARHVLKVHLTILSLLKDALGERQSRVFEIALATEASTAISQVFTPPKASRGQLQLSPDPGANSSNENVTYSKPAKTTGAISALVIGAVLQGIASLERMVTVFKLKEGLNVVQFVRSTRSNSNGNVRSNTDLKTDNLVEVSIHWFRVLIGNSRTVSDGFIVELLGESSIIALTRIQRMLPVNLVFPPAFAIFGFLIWKRFILNPNVITRDNITQLFQSLTTGITDAIKHLPFREICLRECSSLYDLVAADPTDSEFATFLDSGPKLSAFVPLRARIFLNALIDCQLPPELSTPDVSGTNLLEKLVHILDTLQPAKFHWQWVEVRLLLNEQSLIEKMEARDASLVEALSSFSPDGTSENENNFIQMVLTRLLVRPDAAPLFSEVVHLLGRNLEDEVLLQAKWFLRGHDVLFGRKSIRQRLINIADSKGLSTKPQFSKPWGWCTVSANSIPELKKNQKRKFEVVEEGEVVDDGNGIETKRNLNIEAFVVSQQNVTERALVELLLPCIDESSEDSKVTFAGDLIKQMNEIEQQISGVVNGGGKNSGIVVSGVEGPVSKGNTRKGIRGGSPGLARRNPPPVEIILPSPSALRSSMSLRLQLLLRLLPVICADVEPSSRNMRHTLASVVLRLLGSRVVHEDADLSSPASRFSIKREVESLIESSGIVDVGGCLFDRLLLVLHALLSSCQPHWMKPKTLSKFTTELNVYDREAAESLQSELDNMQLPESVRWRIQTAMPYVFPSLKFTISSQPPNIPLSAVASLQPPVPGPTTIRNIPTRATSNGPAKNKPQPAPVPTPPPVQPDPETEIDPWTLLEDGAGCGPSSINASAIAGTDHGNLKASSWLKGAVRVRRMDLTYIGAIDDDS